MTTKTTNSNKSSDEPSKSKLFGSDWLDFIYTNTSQITNFIQFGEKEENYSLSSDYETSKKLFDSYSKRLKNKKYGDTNESDDSSSDKLGYKGFNKSVDDTLYKRLGLNSNATKAEIKSSYRKLALKYHPDKNTEPGAKKKFQEIGEAYRILVDDISRDRYDKIGMARELDMPEMDIDPSVFFMMLFGCDMLEEFIGSLKIESFLKYDKNVAVLLSSSTSSTKFGFNSFKKDGSDALVVHEDNIHNYINTVQNYREARLAMLLRDRINNFIELNRIPEDFCQFIESACRETYVDLLVTSVGWVYENCADTYISENTSFLGLGATYSNLQSMGRSINNGYNIVKSVFSAVSLLYQNKMNELELKDLEKKKQENKDDFSNNNKENEYRSIYEGKEQQQIPINNLISEEKMVQQVEAVLDCFMTIVIYDVESTVKQACVKVCKDVDVDEKTRLRRAYVMKRIGMKMQNIADKVRSEQGKSKIDVKKLVENAFNRARRKSDEI